MLSTALKEIGFSLPIAALAKDDRIRFGEGAKRKCVGTNRDVQEARADLTVPANRTTCDPDIYRLTQHIVSTRVNQ